MMLLRFRFTRLLMWMGLAVVAAYFLDPDRGEARRKEMGKRFERVRKAGEKARVEAGL
jgi:hypothetical protein